MINAERYLEFIIKNKLTQAQFLLLLLLYQGRSDLIKKYKALFPATDGTAIGQTLKNDLIHRGYLIKKDDKGIASSYEVGKIFKENFIDKFQAIEELIELYPGMMSKGGVNYPLTLISDVKYAPIYWNKINGDYQEHQLVLDDIRYMKSNNLIVGKLESFIDSKYWIKIREIKNGELIAIASSKVESNDFN